MSPTRSPGTRGRVFRMRLRDAGGRAERDEGLAEKLGVRWTFPAACCASSLQGCRRGSRAFLDGAAPVVRGKTRFCGGAGQGGAARKAMTTPRRKRVVCAQSHRQAE